MLPETDAGHPAVPRFLILDDLTVGRDGSRVTCQVRLGCSDDLFDGEAREPDTEAGRARAAARATLSAAERAATELSLGLEGIAILDLFGRRYVAVSVEAAVRRRYALLSGFIPVDPVRSVEEAAALASIRAIERWIAL